MSLTHTSRGFKRRKEKGSLSGLGDTFPGCDYTDEEREFMLAMDLYKREHKRPFPSWREVLSVIHSLGYRKIGDGNNGASGS